MTEDLQKEWNDLNLRADGDYGDDKNVRVIKTKSWDLYRRAMKINDTRKAAFFLLHGVTTCHYWVARRCIESMKYEESILREIKGESYYEGYVLDIDDYTKHWLWANGDREDICTKEVIDIIKDEWGYKEEECKIMPKGLSIYQWKCSE